MTAYQNKSSQAEREQVLRNDARVRSGSTFLDHTHSEEGGRVRQTPDHHRQRCRGAIPDGRAKLVC